MKPRRDPSPGAALRRWLAAPVVIGVAFAACRPRAAAESPRPADEARALALGELRRWENARRAATHFERVEPSETALGPDPYVVRVLPPSFDGRGTARFVGVLRGRAALVTLDSSLAEIGRLPAPESPSGVAVGRSGEVFVAGELSSRIARYRFGGGVLRATGSIDLPGVLAMRDVATGPEGVVYVSEEHDGRVLTLRPRPDEGDAPPDLRVDSAPCHEPIHLLRTASALLVDCLLDHAIVVRRVDAHGIPSAAEEARIVHDGPMWGYDAVEGDGGALLVAVGGVEDHPLDRTQGSFGFVDSFVTVYDVTGGRITERARVNTSALGVVTPKAVVVTRAGEDLQVAVAGYASDRMLLLDWTEQPGAPLGDPRIDTRPAAPGLAMMARLDDGGFVAADPLLDAWVSSDSGGALSIVGVDDDRAQARSPESRLGEALFFTTLMAPWDKSDGRLSRFTCETCHFEGYVDGRTHATGRGDVRATTKPLLGLFNNRPHFSRALDPDLTTMVNNEFRVASAKSGHDPWFALSPDDFPWLQALHVPVDALRPEALRRALMAFFMDFSHRPNPAVVGRARFTALEARGAAVFRDRCESCHQARLITDDASTRLPFDAWEAAIFSREGPIVWARAAYEKTGVVPYVSEKGARVVSLRRLYKKYPYFTNGSAMSIADVLDRAAWTPGAFFHEGAPSAARFLDEEGKRALAAFLDLF